MSRKVLSAAKCCQMSSPKTGTGSGGDRCTEAVCAMIDATYKIGPWSKDGQHTVEQIMYQFTEMLNKGSDVSQPENAAWIGDWLHQNASGKITLSNKTSPSFQDVVACIDRGHIAIGGFNDYVNLRLADGSNPYKWNDPHGLGHVLLIVGYDTAKDTVVVHDPLRADPGGQPADYSWAGFHAAVFHDLSEVNGPPLPIVDGLVAPAGWHDDGTTLLAPNGVAVVKGFREWVLTHAWDANDLPLAVERVLPSIEPGNPSVGAGSRQNFRLTSLGWTPGKGVYVIWVGQDIVALEAQVAQLQAQLKAPPVDLAGLKADVATIQALLTPLEAQAQPLQAAEQAAQDIQKKLAGG